MRMLKRMTRGTPYKLALRSFLHEGAGRSTAHIGNLYRINHRSAARKSIQGEIFNGFVKAYIFMI